MPAAFVSSSDQSIAQCFWKKCYCTWLFEVFVFLQMCFSCIFFPNTVIVELQYLANFIIKVIYIYSFH